MFKYYLKCTCMNIIHENHVHVQHVHDQSTGVSTAPVQTTLLDCVYMFVHVVLYYILYI